MTRRGTVLRITAAGMVTIGGGLGAGWILFRSPFWLSAWIVVGCLLTFLVLGAIEYWDNRQGGL